MLIPVLVLAAFAVATAEFVPVGLLPDIAADLAVPLPVAGRLVTVYMLVVTLGGPALLVLFRGIGRRPLLVGSLALSAAAMLGSAAAPGYGTLLAGRAGSAAGQAVFVAVASQVAAAGVAPERRTAAVSAVFGGFALATLAGLPLGTLVGAVAGWRTAFLAVAVLTAAGLVAVALVVPAVPAPAREPTALHLLTRPVVGGLGVTLLALTGFVAVFTYVAPALRDVTGLDGRGVAVALAAYGLGTLAGTRLAARVPAARIPSALLAALTALAAVLAAQPVLLLRVGPAVGGLVVMGALAFVVVPLVQTRLMDLAGPAAGVVAAVNISAAGTAGAAGAALGEAVLSRSGDPAMLGPVAAVPVLLAAVLSGVAVTSLQRDPTR